MRTFAAAVGKIVWHLVVFSSTLPLIVVATIAVFRWQDGWHSLLFAVVACLATVGIQITSQVRDIAESIVGFERFAAEFKQCRFNVPPPHEYVSALRRFFPDEHALSDDQLISHVVPWSARRDPKRLRILAASDSPNLDDPSPPQAVAFATFARKWVVLPMPPQAITEVQYFILLHEFGHLSPMSFGARAVGAGNVSRGLWAVPFLAATISPASPLIFFIVVTGLCWYALARLEQRQDLLTSREEDEIRADVYALRRCRKDWCRRFSGEQLAGLLCKEDSASAAPFALRRKAFVKNVGLLREGRTIETPPELRKHRLTTLLESAAVVTVAVLASLALGPLGWIRLAIVTSMTVVLGVLALGVLMAIDGKALEIENSLRVHDPLPSAAAM